MTKKRKPKDPSDIIQLILTASQSTDEPGSPDDGAPHITQAVFDRELLLRRMLALRLEQWLSKGIFYVDVLVQMRKISSDILGFKGDLSKKNTNELVELDTLHCISFDKFTKIDLRACLEIALRYIHISDRTGDDLLGIEAWAAIKQRVDAICSSEPKELPRPIKRVELQKLDPWSVDVAFMHAIGIFSLSFFDITMLDQACYALNTVREQLGIPTDKHEEKMNYKVLRALHCIDYKKMPRPVIDNIKVAVMDVMGLSEEEGGMIFGVARWERITELAPPGAENNTTGLTRQNVQTSDTLFNPSPLIICMAILGIAAILIIFYFLITDSQFRRPEPLAATKNVFEPVGMEQQPIQLVAPNFEYK